MENLIIEFSLSKQILLIVSPNATEFCKQKYTIKFEHSK